MATLLKSKVYERLQGKYGVNKSYSLEQKHNHVCLAQTLAAEHKQCDPGACLSQDQFVGNVSSGMRCKRCEITVK